MVDCTKSNEEGLKLIFSVWNMVHGPTKTPDEYQIKKVKIKLTILVRLGAISRVPAAQDKTNLRPF